MGIWIRSQDDKGLTFVNDFGILPTEKGMRIHGNQDSIILGEYDTGAEALEVLNRIQNHIGPNIEVFEMPQRGFGRDGE